MVSELPRVLAGDPNADIQVETGDNLFVTGLNSTISIIGGARQLGIIRHDDDRYSSDSFLMFLRAIPVLLNRVA